MWRPVIVLLTHVYKQHHERKKSPASFLLPHVFEKLQGRKRKIPRLYQYLNNNSSSLANARQPWIVFWHILHAQWVVDPKYQEFLRLAAYHTSMATWAVKSTDLKIMRPLSSRVDWFGYEASPMKVLYKVYTSLRRQQIDDRDPLSNSVLHTPTNCRIHDDHEQQGLRLPIWWGATVSTDLEIDRIDGNPAYCTSKNRWTSSV